MKNIKRFGIDVETAFGSDQYGDDYYLNIEDLECGHESAMEGSNIVEITINGDDDETARFALNLENIEALFDALTHIRNKVLAQAPDEERIVISGLEKDKEE